MRIVQFDGLPGSGKTTIIGLLKKRLEAEGKTVYVVKEPLERWLDTSITGGTKNILEMFYEDPKRWGYLFQTYVFITRLDSIRETWSKVFPQSADENVVILMERGMVSDTFFMKTLFRDGTIEKVENEVYTELWAKWTVMTPFSPDVYVYIRPSLNCVRDRLMGRNRPEEEPISLDYLKHLEAVHDEYYYCSSPSMIIIEENYSDEDFRNTEHLEPIYQRIFN